MRTILDRYILKSVTVVAIIAMLLIAVVMQVVDLFQNTDVYLRGYNSFFDIMKLSLLNLPSSLMIAIGPAFLFSVTYFLSMLQANNELICLLNSGISFSRVKIPILLIAVFVSAFSFFFNEAVAIQTNKNHTALLNELRNITSQSDNRNIILNDQNLVLYAQRYYDSSSSVGDVIVFYQDYKGDVVKKLVAKKGHWDEDKAYWVFESCSLYTISYDELSYKVETLETYEDPHIDFALALFRNMSQDIGTMDLREAIDYLRQARTTRDPESFAQLSTSFYQRVLDFLTPLVLIIIACSMNFRFKKNVLLFSLICCIAVAVVYYVARMLTVIMANQGLIPGPWSMLAPAILILLVSLGLSIAFSRS